MRPAVFIMLLLVVAVSSSGALYLMRALGPSEPVGKRPAVSGRVLVAARNVPAGTILKPSHLRWQFWPESDRDESYILEQSDKTAQAGFAGSVARRGIAAGEPITAAKVFKRGDAGFLAGALGPGMRAYSLAITAATSAAGFILPGDRVDVILTQRVRAAGRGDGAAVRVASETILRSVRVLAVDQIVNDVDKQAKVGKTATLEVTPKQAEILALATRMGRLSMSLVSLTPGPDRRPGGFTSDIEVSEALNADTDADTDAGTEAAPARAIVRPDPPAPAPPRLRVLAAAARLPAGHFLRDADLRWAVLPEGALGVGHFVEGKAGRAALRGALIRVAIAPGQPVTEADLVLPGAPGFVAAALAPGKRAVTLDKAAVAGIAHYLAPGDRVDVVLIRALAGPRAEGAAPHRRASETILEDIRLLALDRRSGTAALEVTPEQAAALAVAREMGRITLALRGAASPTAGGAESRAPRAPPESAAPAKAPPHGPVRVYRGSSVRTVRF